MNRLNLKMRFMLLGFMLLLNTSKFNLGSDSEIQTRLLPNLNKTWPGLVTNNNLNLELEDTERLLPPDNTLELVIKTGNSEYEIKGLLFGAGIIKILLVYFISWLVFIVRPCFARPYFYPKEGI